MSTVASARAPASPAAPAPAAAGGRLDAALLAAVVVAVVVFDWAFASRSYFFGDDIVVFWQGKAQGLDFDYLTSPIIGEHFAPGVRLLSFGLERLAPLDWNAALALVLAFHAASVVLVQRILQTLFGRAWWTYGLALTFGLSVILMSRVVWFSAALQGIPAITFALACIHAHLRWWRTRSVAWLAWSVAALCLALLFYEAAVLVPVYLVLLRLLIVRSRPRELLGEWRAWLLYVLPVVALVVIVVAGSYETGGSPKLELVPDYLRQAWLDGFAPAVFGVRVPLYDQTSAHHLAVWGAQAAIAIAVVWSLVRRPPAWRAWVFLAVVFLLDALLVVPRLRAFGPAIAYATRYYTETAYLVPIAVAGAFAVPRSDPGVLRAPRGWIAAAAAGGLAAYVALVVWGTTETVDGSTGLRSRPWFDRVRHGLAVAHRADPQPALLDGRVPDPVVSAWFKPPAQYLSAVVPLFDDRVRFGVLASRTYRVRGDGTLRRVAFVPAYAVPGRHCGERVRVQPPAPLRGREWWLRATYTSAAPIGIVPDVGKDHPAPSLFTLPAMPARGTGVVRLSPTPGAGTAVGAELVAPPGTQACFTGLALGWFR